MMFGLSKIDKIKNENSIDQIVRSYGIELQRKGSSLLGICPFHKDKTPSLSVSPEKNGGLFHCFGCGASGDVINFVEKIDGIPRKEAINKLNEGSYILHSLEQTAQLQPQEVDSIHSEVSDFRRAELLGEIVAVYHKCFKESNVAQEYLRSRGLSNVSLWDTFKIGYSDGASLKKLLPEKGILSDELKSLGLINEKGNESFYHSIIFPIAGSQNDGYFSLYGRSTNLKRHLYTRNKRGGVWNSQAVKGHHSLIITESIIDSLSMIELGYPNTIPLYGTNGFTADHISLLEMNSIKEVILLLDNDDSGKSAISDLIESIGSLNIKITTITLPDGIKDPNQFLVDGGLKTEMDQLIENRSVVFDPAPQDEIDDEDGVISKGDDFVTVKYGTLQYEVRGFRSTFSDALRVVITVSAEKCTRHTDRLDLYTARARKSYSNSCSLKFDVQSARIETDLLNIIQHIEGIQHENSLKKAQESSSEDEVGYQMTQDEKKEALSFLKRPDLLDQIVKDIDTIGYVGEDDAKLLTYISAVSRLSGPDCNIDPISLCVRAHAGSGKSVLFEAVEKLLPGVTRSYNRISAQSLFYMKRTELQNKILLIDEKAGSADSDLSLRSLISSGKLSLAVVSKDPQTGESKTITLEMVGPTVIWESTTASQLNEENLSRVYEIFLQSNSQEQTKQIHDEQRDAFTLRGLTKKDSTEVVIRRNQNAQRLLKPMRVVIPFSDRLNFSVSFTRTRRDNKRFLSLIATITLLHQYQREVKESDGVQYIEATKQDYAVAYRLVSRIMETTYSPVHKDSSDLLEIIFEFVTARSEEEDIDMMDFVFTRREVREYSSCSERKTREALYDLTQLEYVERVTGKRGGTFRYRLLITPEEFKKPSCIGLIRPEKL